MLQSKFSRFAAYFAVGTALTLTSAVASPITGTLQVAGSVQVSASSIDFLLPVGPPNGQLQLQNTGNTGSFSVLNGAFHTASILDLNGGPQTGPLSSPLVDFIDFAGTPLAGARLDLTNISAGSDPSTNCNPTLAGYVGETCSPPGSPFNLQDVTVDSASNGTPCNTTGVLNGVSDCATNISFNFSGTAVSATGETSLFTAAFSTQVPAPETYQEILETLVSGGSFEASYSGTIVATVVPEPNTLMMLLAGSGMLLIGFFTRKYRASR